MNNRAGLMHANPAVTLDEQIYISTKKKKHPTLGAPSLTKLLPISEHPMPQSRGSK